LKSTVILYDRKSGYTERNIDRFAVPLLPVLTHLQLTIFPLASGINALHFRLKKQGSYLGSLKVTTHSALPFSLTLLESETFLPI
jgi:hypothetical protein